MTADTQVRAVSVGRRVSRKELQKFMFAQFGNFLHTQPTLEFIRDIGPAYVRGLGWVIGGNGGQKRWTYHLCEVQEC